MDEKNEKMTKQEVIDRLEQLIDINLSRDYSCSLEETGYLIECEAYSYCISLIKRME